MRRTVTTWMGAVLCASALAGCGGSSSDSPSGTAASAAATTASPAASSDPAAGSGSSLYTDAEACDWLKENLPKFASAGDEVGVQAQLTIGLANFFDEHGGLAKADGYAYDEATLRGCKAEHDQAIKLAGIKSFGNL